jgi:DNA-binding IclR family transcriptional regulator
MLVKQAANVLDLLEYFAETRKPATLTEVSEALGWPRSSTYNLLSTLVDRGYLYEPHNRFGLYPSPRWLALAQAVADAQPLPRAVYTMVNELVDETGETCAIGAAAGLQAIFIHVVESPSDVRYTAPVGHRLPIHATATGRAILAQYSKTERDWLLKRVQFERYTASTLMSIDDVEAELKRSAERGWHQNLAGHSPDLYGAAVPLAINSRRLAVVVAGPSFRVKDKLAQIGAAIHAAIKRHQSDF